MEIKREKSNSEEVFKLVQEYSEYTTIQGIHYIFRSNQSKIGIFFWTLVVLALSSLGMFWSIKAYKDWQENLVLTTVNTTAYPITNIEFPAFTICGPGMNDDVIQAGVLKEFFKFIESSGTKVNVTPIAAAALLEQYFDSNNATSEIYELWNVLTHANKQAFLDAKFPGMTVEDGPLTDVIRLMTSDSPDPVIKAAVGLNGGYDPCSNYQQNSSDETPTLSIRRRKRSADDFEGCDTGFVTDNSSDYCYSTLSGTDDPDAAYGLCNNLDANLILFDNDYQVQGFINLTLQGKLILPSGSSFVLAASRNAPNSFYFDGYNTMVNNLTFPSLVPISEKNTHSCVKATLAKSKLELRGANCSLSYAIICRALKRTNFTADCSGGNSSASVTDNTLDFIFNPKMKEENTKAAMSWKGVYKSLFKRLNQTAAYKSMFSMLWYSTIPCFDVSGITSTQDGEKGMLRSCQWKGKLLPCAAIFTQFPTDKGMCCTFNMRAADDIFNGKSYSNLVMKLQDQDRKGTFVESSPPLFYKDEPKSRPGTNKGLTIVLDAHNDQISPGSVDGDFQMFTGLITHSGSFPLTFLRGFQIRPGHNNLIAMSASKVTPHEDLRSNVKAADRNCYFSDEYKLTLHKNYTQDNCFLECNLAWAKSKMSEKNNLSLSLSCTPWFFPSAEDSITVCDPWESADFFAFMLNDIPDDQCSHCLPDCERIIYEPKLTAVPFRRCDESNFGVSKFCNLEDSKLPEPRIWGQQVLDEYKEGPNPDFIQSIKSNFRNYPSNVVFKKSGMATTYDAYENDIATVQVFFDTPTVFQYVRQPRLTWVDFFSSIGGLLGLCLGLSIVTVVELFWLCIKIGSKIVNPKNN